MPDFSQSENDWLIKELQNAKLIMFSSILIEECGDELNNDVICELKKGHTNGDHYSYKANVSWVSTPKGKQWTDFSDQETLDE